MFFRLKWFVYFFVFAAVFGAPVLAQDAPKIAVCVTGLSDPNVGKVVASTMLGALAGSGRYSALERQGEFAAQAALELKSGAADYAQIRETGKRFGASFVCVVEVMSALGSNLVSARIIGVESSGVVAMGNTASPLKTMQDLSEMSARVIDMMFKPAAAPADVLAVPAAPLAQAVPVPALEQAVPAAPAAQIAPAPAAAQSVQAAAAPRAKPVVFRDAKSGIDMVLVRGGTFNMGCTAEQRGCMSDESPVRRVTLGDFYIGKHEVTQKQWTHIMGANPSNFKGGDLPVENVSWNDVQDFITKLSAVSGRKYRLPTEAEWEFAARGGAAGTGYIYAGSDNVGDVAWYTDNSDNRTHPVGTKAPNGYGIHDMSGNVWEWVYDVYGNYPSADETDPQGASSGSLRVSRGGSWGYGDGDCRVSLRYSGTLTNRRSDLGFRLAISLQKADPEPVAALDAAPVQQAGQGAPANLKPDNIIGNMVYVEGGSFRMGCSAEQRDCYENEKPASKVTLNGFYIGKYEVTQKLWREVMGANPSYFTGDNLPVDKVGWNDVQTFIYRLNEKTGKKYRLPTEAEWEFAARGGNKSGGYRYAGSNNIGSVAWYEANSGGKSHPVGTRLPNELGIYDMNGNVLEWVNDWYDDYTPDAKTNPTGPSSISGLFRTYRGGSWNNTQRACRIPYRVGSTPDPRYNVGFRLALTP